MAHHYYYCGLKHRKKLMTKEKEDIGGRAEEEGGLSI
jgi:hypothetical protein